MIDYAHGIKVDAMTLLGGYLEGMPKNAGRAGPGRGNKGVKPPPTGGGGFTQPPALADLDIDYNVSSDAQALAALNREAPDEHAHVRAGKKSIRAAALFWPASPWPTGN